jgi:hypothetical protein
MAQLSCSRCLLRFGRSPVAVLAACPSCGEALELVASPETVGHRLCDIDGAVPALSMAPESALLAAVTSYLEPT